MVRHGGFGVVNSVLWAVAIDAYLGTGHVVRGSWLPFYQEIEDPQGKNRGVQGTSTASQSEPAIHPYFTTQPSTFYTLTLQTQLPI